MHLSKLLAFLGRYSKDYYGGALMIMSRYKNNRRLSHAIQRCVSRSRVFNRSTDAQVSVANVKRRFLRKPETG